MNVWLSINSQFPTLKLTIPIFSISILAVMIAATRLAAQEGSGTAGRNDLQINLENLVRQAEEQRANAIAVIRKLPEANDIPAAARQACAYAGQFLEIHQDGATPDKAKGVFLEILKQRQKFTAKEAGLQQSLARTEESLRAALSTGLERLHASQQALELTYRRAIIMRQQMVRFQSFAQELPVIYDQLNELDPELAVVEIRKAVEKELVGIEQQLSQVGTSKGSSN